MTQINANTNDDYSVTSEVKVECRTHMQVISEVGCSIANLIENIAKNEKEAKLFLNAVTDVVKKKIKNIEWSEIHEKK